MARTLWGKSAMDLVRGFRAGQFTPLEVLDAVLGRIEVCEPTLNAFRLVDRRRARHAARASTARWAKGRPCGLLDGVPVAIKDVTETRGWPTLNGSLAVDPAGPWREDAVVVERFKAHGAVIVGKTNTPEFAWRGITESAVHGVSRNPWNPQWTPGGSSGGAAAAVAAGLVPIATGTDSGGSVRGPASFCNVVGLKPTFGRVPVWPASPMMMLEHCGPLTRDVRDAALAMNVMAGFDPRDGYALPDPPADFLAGLGGGVRGLRIAYSANLGLVEIDQDVARIVAASRRIFSGLGATVTNVNIDLSPDVSGVASLYDPLAARIRQSVGRRRPRLRNPVLIERAELGSGMSALAFLEGEASRCRLRARMAGLHERYDLLIAPTLASAPFALGHDCPPARGAEGVASDVFAPTVPFDLTGQPAISMPCGFTAGGAPVGVQIIGPLGRDALVLRAARAFERANPVGRKRPPL